MRIAVDEALATLTPREEKVIRGRYGLVARGKTFSEMGEEQGVSRVRVCQIRSKALRKLRHPSRSKAIKGLLERSGCYDKVNEKDTPVTQ